MHLSALLPILDPSILGWDPEFALAQSRSRWPDQVLLRTRDIPTDRERDWLALFAQHYPGRLICNCHTATQALHPSLLRHLPEGTTPHNLTTAYGMSAHSLKAVHRAVAAGATWILLSPVRATASHPQAQPMDQAAQSQCIQAARDAGISIFALGGLGPTDLPWALSMGYHGVAGIRSFFS